MDALTFLYFNSNIFFWKLIVACRLCVIYVREDNDSTAHMDLTVPRKAVKFNHSLT